MGCYKTSALNRTIQNNYLDGFSCVNNVISYTKPEQDWDICRFNSVFKSDRMPEVLIYLESLSLSYRCTRQGNDKFYSTNVKIHLLSEWDLSCKRIVHLKIKTC